jgi:two-component sensor histidine kinase
MAPSPDVALTLTLAVIASSTAPLLLLESDLTVIAASTSFCRAFQIEPTTVPGTKLFELGAGEWNVPQLLTLMKATADGHAEIEGYEMDLRCAGREPRCLVLNAQKLAYADADNIRLLLSVSDITDARIAEKLKDDLLRQKDGLLRDKAVLHQELHHRVANSLQIIASVLMQSARNVRSEETRGHLFDAHSRVLSVAAVQRQLSSSSLGEVKMHSYLKDLCQSIGASMIHDHRKLKLEVSADESTVNPDVSISLGLIVTELVINALKHAFPDHHIGGKIMVDYHADKRDWTLSVADNGVGMAAKPESAKSGLGTSLIQAIAMQLHARVKVADARPGTSVSIIHTQAAIDRIGKVIPIHQVAV